MQKYINSVADKNGKPVAGASILVQNYPSLTTATIYSDNNSTALSNPITTDSNGAFSFYAADGRYALQITGATITPQTVSDILLEDPTDGGAAGSFSSLTVAGAATVGGSSVQTAATLAASTASAAIGTTAGNVQSDINARPTSTTLAATTGAASVGSDDGASGSLWTTVAGFIAKIISSAGASVVSTVDGGTVAASLMSKINRVVDSITALRALSKAQYTRAFVTGYYAAGDGGGGLYWYDSTDTTTADNGGSVIVATDGGRWKLAHNGKVSVKQFGARGNDTDDTTAFQAAINAVGCVYVPNTTSYYRLTSLSLAGGQTLIGDAPWVSLRHVGSGTLFTLAGYNIRIQNFNIECSTTTVGARLFLIDTATTAMEYLWVENIKATAPWKFLEDSGGANVATNVQITNVSCRSIRGAGISVSKLWAFIFVTNVTFDYTGNTASANAGGFAFTGNAGLIMKDCDVLGTAGTGTFANQIGFNFSNCQAVWMYRCMSDTLGSYGFRISGCSYFYITNCTASLCDATGFLIGDTSTIIKLTGCYVGGRQGQAGAAASAHGYQITNTASYVSMNGVIAKSCTGDGINAAAPNRLTTAGCHMVGNAGRGLVTSGSSVSIHSGMQFDQNTTGNYSVAAAFDFVVSSQAQGGGLLNVTGPATG